MENKFDKILTLIALAIATAALIITIYTNHITAENYRLRQLIESNQQIDKNK